MKRGLERRKEGNKPVKRRRGRKRFMMAAFLGGLCVCHSARAMEMGGFDMDVLPGEYEGSFSEWTDFFQEKYSSEGETPRETEDPGGTAEYENSAARDPAGGREEESGRSGTEPDPVGEEITGNRPETEPAREEIPWSGAEAESAREETPWNGAEAEPAREERTGSGTETEPAREERTGSGTETGSAGEETPWNGAESGTAQWNSGGNDRGTGVGNGVEDGREGDSGESPGSGGQEESPENSTENISREKEKTKIEEGPSEKSVSVTATPTPAFFHPLSGASGQDAAEELQIYYYRRSFMGEMPGHLEISRDGPVRILSVRIDEKECAWALEENALLFLPEKDAGHSGGCLAEVLLLYEKGVHVSISAPEAVPQEK